MGEASGAGVIFGNTGGVMEAALRTAYHQVTGHNAPADFYDLEPVRGLDGIREAQVRLGDLSLKVAVIYGTEHVRQFLEEKKEKLADYTFIEVMTCPGGCIGAAVSPKGRSRRGRICWPNGSRACTREMLPWPTGTAMKTRNCWNSTGNFTGNR